MSVSLIHNVKISWNALSEGPRSILHSISVHLSIESRVPLVLSLQENKSFRSEMLNVVEDQLLFSSILVPSDVGSYSLFGHGVTEVDEEPTENIIRVVS